MTGCENVGVFIWGKVRLENSLNQTFSHINTLALSNPVILHTYLPVKMEQSVLKCWRIQGC